PNIASARDSGEVVETPEQPVLRESLKHAEVERGTADPAARKGETAEIHVQRPPRGVPAEGFGPIGPVAVVTRRLATSLPPLANLEELAFVDERKRQRWPLATESGGALLRPVLGDARAELVRMGEETADPLVARVERQRLIGDEILDERWGGWECMELAAHAIDEIAILL